MKGRDIVKLQDRSVDEEGARTDQGRFMDYVEEKLGWTWDTEFSIEEKWNSFNSVLCGGRLRQS